MAWALCLAALVACAPTEGQDTSFKPKWTSNADFTVRLVSVGEYPINLATGDLDGDGSLDVAVSNRYGASLTVLTGGLTTSRTITVGPEPTDVVISDLDGLNNPDLAVLDNSGERVTVFLATPGGDWALAEQHPLGGVATQLSVTDVDNDGDQDLVVSLSELGEVWALLNDGHGSFTAVASAANVGPARFISGDWDGDGDSDLAVLNPPVDKITILLWDATAGAYVASPAEGIALKDNPSQVVLFDYDSDGPDDLAVSNRTGHAISVLVGDGNGGFALQSNYSVISGPGQLVAANLDGSGSDDDLAVVHRGQAVISVLRNTGAAFEITPFAVSDDPFAIASGRFNDDNPIDLAVVEREDRVLSILAGNGSGGFSRTVVGFESRVSFPRTVDLDGAGGRDDLLLLQSFVNRLVVLENVH